MAFKTTENKIVELLSNNLLEIPRNQRRYVWDKSNWEDLLTDITFIVDNKPSNTEHFLGSVVLRKENDVTGIEKYSIIDGQQRTITIILFLLAVIRILIENLQYEDAKGTVQFLFVKDRKNNDHFILVSEPHLALKDLVEEICNSRPDDSIEALLSSLSVTKKEKVFLDGFEYFYSRLSDLSRLRNYEYIVEIKDALLDARYIKIIADSDADAYTIFEILNARGQTLEGYEMLKNYLMRYITPKEKVDEVKVKWEEIENLMGKNMSNFFRHYVTHLVGNSSQSVYRTLQQTFPKNKVAELLDDLYVKAHLYYSILSPDITTASHPEEYEIFSYLKSSRSQQLRPLILSLLTAFKTKKVTQQNYMKTLRFVRNFFVCFTIISSEKSNKLTEIIERYAPLIAKNASDDTLNELIDSMRKKMPNKDTFIKSFCELGYSKHYGFYKDDSKKKRVQAALNLFASLKSRGTIVQSLTIEHILPDATSQDNAKIGNLTLLEDHLNKRCKDKPLEEKLSIYMESDVKITRNIVERYSIPDNEFNPEIRGKIMAEEIYEKIVEF